MKKALLSVIALMIFSSLSSVFANSGRDTIAGIVAQSGGAGEFDQDPFDYDMLLNAVIAADLVDALNDPQSNLTLFAPNDLGFILTARDLGYDGTDEEGAFNFIVGALTDLDPDGDPIPLLTQILLYHVVGEELDVIDFLVASFFGWTIPTLQGGELLPRFIRIEDAEPDLRDPFLFFPLNVRASNGFIHTLQRVLIPIDIP